VSTSSSLHMFIVIFFWTFSFSYIDVFLGNLLSRNHYTYAHNDELCVLCRLWNLNLSHISVEGRSVDIFLCCYFVEESHRLSSDVLHQQRQYLHPLSLLSISLIVWIALLRWHQIVTVQPYCLQLHASLFYILVYTVSWWLDVQGIT